MAYLPTRTEISSGSWFLADVQAVRWWRAMTQLKVRAKSIQLTGNWNLNCFVLNCTVKHSLKWYLRSV